MGTDIEADATAAAPGAFAGRAPGGAIADAALGLEGAVAAPC
jgi:hypothetical protein